jgi:protein-tyrosine phosphatase
VHCRAGLGRTGTIIGCYLIQKYKISDIKQLDQLKTELANLKSLRSTVPKEWFLTRGDGEEVSRFVSYIDTSGSC